MHFIRYYSHEFYTVITILLITLSAIFLTPDAAQKFALAYAAIFLLHEWEENNYPGGFFDVMLSEVMKFDPVPPEEKLRCARIYVYLLLLCLTLLPFCLHNHIWLILPFVYLGILEGFVHTNAPRIFRLKRKVVPGVVTAVCSFALSVFTLCYLIVNHLVNPWLYLAAVPILLCGLFVMGRFGMAANGIKFSEALARAKNNFKELRQKEKS
jgi:hypothetical protein